MKSILRVPYFIFHIFSYNSVQFNLFGVCSVLKQKQSSVTFYNFIYYIVVIELSSYYYALIKHHWLLTSLDWCFWSPCYLMRLYYYPHQNRWILDLRVFPFCNLLIRMHSDARYINHFTHFCYAAYFQYENKSILVEILFLDTTS